MPTGLERQAMFWTLVPALCTRIRWQRNQWWM